VLEIPFAAQPYDEYYKRCGRQYIKKIIGPVGVINKKGIVFIKAKKNIQQHP
jgi:glycerol-3-phosphate responsive antiterminator